MGLQSFVVVFTRRIARATPITHTPPSWDRAESSREIVGFAVESPGNPRKKHPLRDLPAARIYKAATP
jgi:hypothetical protein